MSIENIWEEISKRLKEEYDEMTYNAWFRYLKPVSADKNAFYLVTSRFNAKQINSYKYHEKFKEIYRDLYSEEKDFLVLSEDSIGSIPEYEEIEFSKNKRDDDSSQLNPKYVFDNFVVGTKNHLAYAASVSVAKSPGTEYNPLYIYGGVGLGKTHLMHAIGNYIKEQNPNTNIVYISCETFTNDYIDSIRYNTTDKFRQKYRSSDVLLIDDIQFLASKEQTQEAFFHTFETLYLDKKQIVISSDRTPDEIDNLAARLKSRFKMGLIADIAPPDFETRIAILRKKAGSDENRIDQEVYEYISKHIHSNIRDLEGALTRTLAFANLTETKNIDINLCLKALSGIINDNKKKIDENYIRKLICEYFNVTERDLDSSRKPKSIAFPRQVAMYLIRDYTDLSLPKIGEIFGNRDHSTVVHAYEKITNDIIENEKIKEMINELKAKIDN